MEGNTRSRRSWLKQQSFRRNPFQSSGRNSLPSLDDAFGIARSSTKSKSTSTPLTCQVTSSETDVSENDEIGSNSVCSLSARSVNLSVLSIGCRAAAAEHQRQVSKFGFDDSLFQTPPSTSDPSNEDWEKIMDGNTSILASASFFEGKSDVSAIRSSYELSLYDSPSVVDQNYSDFFEDSSRLKLLVTPEKNKQKVDEASKFAILRLRSSSKTSCDIEDMEVETLQRRREHNEGVHLEAGEEDFFSICGDFFNKNDFSSPKRRNMKFNSDLLLEHTSGDSPFILEEEEELTPNCRNIGEAVSAVKQILERKQESPLRLDLSKLTINESSTANHTICTESPSEISVNVIMSPLSGGFFSEQHRAIRKLGLFELSPIASEKGKKQQADHGVRSFQCTFDEFPSPENRQFPAASFDENDDIVKNLSCYLTKTIQDSSIDGRSALTLKQNLVAKSNIPIENIHHSEGFFLTPYQSNDPPISPKGKHLFDTSCISFVGSEFATDVSFSSTTCDYGGGRETNA